MARRFEQVNGLTKKRRIPVSALYFSLFLSASFAMQTWAQSASSAPQSVPVGNSENETSRDYNQKLQQLVRQYDAQSANSSLSTQDYRVGTQDLLQISVYGAPDLSGEARVTADGLVTLPLIGSVPAAGMTIAQLDSELDGRLRETYMKDPHVDVFVKEMQSHSVSVFGAVEKPGVFQLATPKPLIEVLSMAEGLADDAGDTVILMRRNSAPDSAARLARNADPEATQNAKNVSSSKPDMASATNPIEINLNNLLNTGDPRYNVLVYPGDVIKVTRAGVVYVIGEVNKPGGYVLKNNENISVLQAIALSEGETHTAAGNHARIIRTNSLTGERTEFAINLKKILAGRAPDPQLQAKDILFVPNSAGKAALYRSTDGILATVGGAAVYRW